MDKIIRVNSCWHCPLQRQGTYCDHPKTMNMNIREYATGEAGKIHPNCPLDNYPQIKVFKQD